MASSAPSSAVAASAKAAAAADAEPWIVDAHTHVLPERLARKIRAFFNAVIADADAAEDASDAAAHAEAPPLACCPPASAFDASYDDAAAFPSPGRLRYPYHESDPALLAQSLCDVGIKGSWLLPYAHKAGVAAPLNAAMHAIALSLRSHGQAPIIGLTAHPADGRFAVGAYTREAIAQGARVAKLHCSVGEYSVLAPGLELFWEAVEECRVPVVVHAGSHVSGNTASPEMRDIEEVARRYPNARVVIAHSGSPAVKAAMEVCERCENVYLDTTPTGHASHASLLALARSGRVLFGSDVPNVSLPLEAQMQGVVRLFGSDADRRALDAGEWREVMRGIRERGEGDALAEVFGRAAERLVGQVRTRKAGL